MYDQDQVKTFKPFQKDTPRPNDDIYKMCKRMLGHAGDITRLPPAQKKHFTAYREFVDMWESGVVRSWQDFFKTSEEMATSPRE